MFEEIIKSCLIFLFTILDKSVLVELFFKWITISMSIPLYVAIFFQWQLDHYLTKHTFSPKTLYYIYLYLYCNILIVCQAWCAGAVFVQRTGRNRRFAPQKSYHRFAPQNRIKNSTSVFASPATGTFLNSNLSCCVLWAP